VIVSVRYQELLAKRKNPQRVRQPHMAIAIHLG
jgi:hypothetical protein